MKDIRDTFVLLFAANIALIIGSIFHAFAATVATPVMIAFIATSISFYCASAFAFALAIASLFIAIRDMRKEASK